MAQPELDQLWEKRMQAWQGSGLSAPKFCKQEGLVYHQFAYWRRKLEHSGTSSEVASQPSEFVRVGVVHRQPYSVGEQLTVALPNGIVITGLQAHNVELLGAILRQL